MVDNQITRVLEVDMRGQVCPSCLLVAMASMNRYREALLSGEVQLLIKTDNREATNTIPETAENMGYIVVVKGMVGYYEIVVRSPQTARDTDDADRIL